MGFIAILFTLSFLVVGGNLANKSDDSLLETKKIEAVAIKPIETKPVIKEITPQPVKEEVKAEPVIKEITPEPVKEEEKAEPVEEEVKVEPVKEEVKVEPVKEEVKVEPVKEEAKAEETEKNYLKLIIYIVLGIAAIFAGTYFFTNRKSVQSASSTADNSRKDSEETFQPETAEPQSVEEEVQPETAEPQPVEEEVQPETAEPQQTDEDEKNNK